MDMVQQQIQDLIILINIANKHYKRTVFKYLYSSFVNNNFLRKINTNVFLYLLKIEDGLKLNVLNICKNKFL